MLPRVLRVVRAKAIRKTALASAASRTGPKSKVTKSGQKHQLGTYRPKLSSEVSSFKGRASKLLGKAGAAQFKSGANGTVIGRRGEGVKERMGTERIQGTNGAAGVMRTPESIVFEGYRASAKSGKPRDLKLGGSGGGKKKEKPRTRGAKRASEWKKTGGRKAK
jgi:nucleolar protein 12